MPDLDRKFVPAAASLVSRKAGTVVGRKALQAVSEGCLVRIRAASEFIVEADVERLPQGHFAVELLLKPTGHLAVDCACSSAIPCMHVVAAAYALCFAADARAIPLPSPEGWSLPRPGSEAYNQLALVTRDVVFSGPASVRIPAGGPEPKAGSARTKRPDPWWREYLNAETQEERTRILLEQMRVGLRTRPGDWMAQTVAGQIVREHNPVELLRQYNTIMARVASERFGGRFTPESSRDLAEFLASDEAANFAQRTDLEYLGAQFSKWEAPGGQVPERQVRIEWSCVSFGTGGLSRLAYRFLLPSPGGAMLPRKKTAILRLHNEVMERRQRVVPVEKDLVNWLTGYQEILMAQVSREDEFLFGARNPFDWMKWSCCPGLVEWDDGTPVEWCPRMARLILSESDESAMWEVEIPAAERDRPPRILSLGDCVLLVNGVSRGADVEEPAYVRVESCVHLLDTAAMTERMLETILRNPRMPLETMRRWPNTPRVARHFRPTRGSSRGGGLFRCVPVQVTAEFRLQDKTKIAVTLRAESRDGRVFHRTKAGWRQAEVEVEPPPAAEPTVAQALEPLSNSNEGEVAGFPVAETDVVLPDAAFASDPRPEDVEPVEQWLATLVPDTAFPWIPPGAPPGVAWHFDPRSHLKLLEKWEVRPARVRYLGNPAFRALLDPIRPARFHITVEPSGMDWLELSVELEGELQSLTASEAEALLHESENDRLVSLPGRGFVRREDLEEFALTARLLSDVGIGAQAGTHRLHAMSVSTIAGQVGSAGNGLAELLAPFMKRARLMAREFTGIPAADVHPDTAPWLRAYQRGGVDFLVWAARNLGGALLADEMGLGKTLQVLAALTALQAGEPGRPSLVICPASVAHNWQREAARFAPHLRVAVVERGAARGELLSRTRDYDILITNYALARRDREALEPVEWLAVIVDEAQAIKNPSAEITRTVSALTAKHRFALTGTPVENRLGDLLSILRFAVSGYLPAVETAAATDDAGNPNPAILRPRLKPILLRRLKSEVAPELPDRVEERIDCELTEGQRRVYLAEVRRARGLLSGADNDRVTGKSRIQVLAALMRLREICCDPTLVGHEQVGSGKTDVLLETLPEILESGHKVLVFSQFVRMLERLRPAIEAQGIPTRMLTGRTRNRQELVDEFEADPTPSVFLISLKAGGTGLNLVSASHVVIFDPWWNPAVEAQAIDRTHRIGQDKTVVALRLVTEGTIEERIMELQEKKRGLVSGILTDDAFNKTLTREDFRYLLGAD